MLDIVIHYSYVWNLSRLYAYYLLMGRLGKITIYRGITREYTGVLYCNRYYILRCTLSCCTHRIRIPCVSTAGP
jgi:hypothetical protein